MCVFKAYKCMCWRIIPSKREMQGKRDMVDSINGTALLSREGKKNQIVRQDDTGNSENWGDGGGGRQCEVKVPVCGVRWLPARGHGTFQLLCKAGLTRWKRRLAGQSDQGRIYCKRGQSRVPSSLSGKQSAGKWGWTTNAFSTMAGVTDRRTTWCEDMQPQQIIKQLSHVLFNPLIESAN